MATKIEVAKLFSRMGFEIDTTQLERFEQLTRTIRASTVKLARDLRQTNNQLTSVSTKLRSVNNGLNSVNSRKGAGNLSQSYASLSRNVNVAQTALNRMNRTVTAIEPHLVTQASTVSRLAQSWGDYASRVREANRQLRDRPSGTPPRPNGSGGAGGGGTGGGSGGSGRGGGGSGFGAGLAGGALGRFAGAFAPASAIAGGALTAGYTAKQVITVGRDFTAMKQILLASSKNTEDFNRNLEFTKKTANSLGTNVIEFGKAYAKTIQAVGDKLPREKTEAMFKQFSELMVVMHSSDDDQKGVFRAMSQMFSKGKVQMEEINQMAERNVPALAMMTRAYKELGYTQAEFEKMQQQGKIDPTEFLPLMAKYASEFANNNDALKKAMESSVTQQGIFMNKMREMANAMMEAGLDKALGDMFKGLTKLATAFAPLALWIAKVTVALINFIGIIKDFVKEHPVIAGLLGMFIGGMVGLRMAMRAGITVGGAFFMAMVRGLTMLKVAMIKTAILAIFIGIAEVLVALYQHMNGENNWLSVAIKWFTLLGLKIQGVWLDFQMLISALTRGFKDSWLGQFFSKLFSFDFSKAFQGANEGYKQQQQGTPLAQLPSGAPVQQANPFGITDEQRKQMQQRAGYATTFPMAQAQRMNGTMNIGHTLRIENGQQVVTRTNTQTVDTGGLRK